MNRVGPSLRLSVLVVCALFFQGCDTPEGISFQEITGDELPATAEIIDTQDSPSDFHGDYGRILKVKVGADYYKGLEGRLRTKGLKVSTDAPRLEEFGNDTVRFSTSQIAAHYSYEGNTIYYYVGFYQDEETILLIRSSW